MQWPWWYRSDNVMANNLPGADLDKEVKYSTLGMALLNGGSVPVKGSYQAGASSGLNVNGDDPATDMGV